MTNAIVKDLLAKNDWDRIIFRFPTSSYTLFRSDKYEIDSFCVYIHTYRDYPEMQVLDIDSLISMDIKFKKDEFNNIVDIEEDILSHDDSNNMLPRRLHVDKFGHRYRAKTTCIIKQTPFAERYYLTNGMQVSKSTCLEKIK